MTKPTKKIAMKQRLETPSPSRRRTAAGTFGDTLTPSPSRRRTAVQTFGDALTSSMQSLNVQELPPTPLGRPWKVLVQSARENHHNGKRLRVRSSSVTSTRRSRRLSGVPLTEVDIDLPQMSQLEKQIHDRMNELQNIDFTELKRKLAKRGKVTVTPKNKRQRPTYNLLNPDSINRKFIDQEAIRLLDDGGDENDRFQSRPGAIYLQRAIFTDDNF